jgi:hypothetical protein
MPMICYRFRAYSMKSSLSLMRHARLAHAKPKHAGTDLRLFRVKAELEVGERRRAVEAVELEG